jgi:hypothetical protein
MLHYEELYIINSTVAVLMDPLTPVKTHFNAFGERGRLHCYGGK